jgi:hypothetical protein
MATPITSPGHPPTLWTRLPVSFRAVLTGLIVFAVTANVWLVLLVKMGTLAAAVIEALFLAGLVWWSHGGGPPQAAKAFRAKSFRSVRLTSSQWIWGLLAALFFAATVHASIVLLFRFVPYPADAFRRGYDLPSFPRRHCGGWQWWSRRHPPESAKRLAFAASCSSPSSSATVYPLQSSSPRSCSWWCI